MGEVGNGGDFPTSPGVSLATSLSPPPTTTAAPTGTRGPVPRRAFPGGDRGRRLALRVVALLVLYGLWELAARTTQNPAFTALRRADCAADIGQWASVCQNRVPSPP